MSDLLVPALTAILFGLGLAGSVLPALPGPPLIFLGALIFAWADGFHRVGWPTLAGLAVATGVLQVLDYLAGVHGVRKLGGGRAGAVGAVAGGLVGLVFLGPLGFLAGAFLLAAALEWAFGQELRRAIKIGLGGMLGALAGMAIRLVASLGMIAWFLWAAWP